ncbi:MAG TPA: NAD+ synthase [Candidatus Omnitrophota bacterium]|nr:NAD+ synthase [Candidatus Omnitrophota bacterium]
MEKKLVSWIKNQVKKAKAKGIVLGISGGVDSSVVAVLSQKAIGKNLLCLILPCHSLKEDLDDAKLLARKFKLNTKTINLAGVYDNFLKILPESDTKTKGNIKARLRMITLYYFANKLNYLVAGTGNKSELYAGYFTKYGDAGVDILPIADLYKSQVRSLARSLGIPQRIIDKPPSAGLWQGQTDEGEMGITYNDLDSALGSILGRKKARKSRHIGKVKSIIAKTEHKRKPAAICYI